MDQDRAIRFAIPPLFFFASLLWGAYLAHVRNVQTFIIQQVLGLVAAAVPVGYLIISISVFLLREIIFPAYEAKLSRNVFENIWGQLNTNLGIHNEWTLYAAATFDHELLSPDIHKWSMRRWNSFNVSAHSIVALLLAHCFGLFFSIPQECKWWISTIILITVLFTNARRAWLDTMGMLEFQSHRQQGSHSNRTSDN